MENKTHRRNQSGWLGEIFSTLLGKYVGYSKNEMILPDDTNPSIVWDQNAKCFINMENNNNGDETPKLLPPPPTNKPLPKHTKISKLKQREYVDVMERGTPAPVSDLFFLVPSGKQDIFVPQTN